MAGVTKARMQEIQRSAQRIVHGAGRTWLRGNVDKEARRAAFVAMAKQLSADEGIGYPAARRHVAKAARILRNPDYEIGHGWGGKREANQDA